MHIIYTGFHNFYQEAECEIPIHIYEYIYITYISLVAMTLLYAVLIWQLNVYCWLHNELDVESSSFIPWHFDEEGIKDANLSSVTLNYIPTSFQYDTIKIIYFPIMAVVSGWPFGK